MNRFWHFARLMLRYRAMLAVALIGAMLDAACMLGGIATLSAVISQFFQGTDHNGAVHHVRDLIVQKLGALPEKAGPFQSLVAGLKLERLADRLPDTWFGALATIMGLILVMTVLGSLGRFLHEYCTLTAATRTIMRIRRMVFGRLVYLPMACSEGSTTQITKVLSDCTTLSAGFSAITSRAIRGVFTGISLFIGALITDWKLTAIFLLVVPPIFILIHQFGRRIRRASRRTLEQYGHMMSALVEIFSGIRVVKVHHAEGYERRRFARLSRSLVRQELRARLTKAISSPVVETLMIVGVMVVVLVAGWSNSKIGGEPGGVAGVLLLLGASAMQFRSLTGLNNTIQESAAAADRLDQAIHMDVEPAARQEWKEQRRTLPRHNHCLEFQNIRFTYPTGSRPALDGVRLSVPFGKMCAIVGGNGSGKSTLLNLIPRLYEPGEGRVLIDGVDIAGCTLRSLRRQIAMVTQETILFEGTIAENISYGSRHVTLEPIIEAAKRAYAHEFISALPEGYHAPVGERGARLSGGQRQRVAIARAILRDPSILILDEATSQIDADSESKIAAALGQFMRNRTTFVIAHRLSTVVGADMIVVMDAGKIVAIGRHQELLADNEIYRTLCRTQMIDSAAA